MENNDGKQQKNAAAANRINAALFLGKQNQGYFNENTSRHLHVLQFTRTHTSWNAINTLYHEIVFGKTGACI